MRVIFCGVDGVLHPWNAAAVAFGEVPQRLFEWTDILGCLLAPHDDVFVVVHSRLRHEWTDTELRDALKPVANRFLGSVPHGPRYPSILEWLGRHRSVSSYRILDDEAHEFPDPPPAQLLLCHPEGGIYEWRIRRQLQQWLHAI